jgi:phosphoribosylformimino-5-aminoimidazole carboxamide ribotide isomerase
MSETSFRVIPVLDVMDRRAVHAVGGIRSHYRPLESKLHPSSEPVAIAAAYRDVLGLHDLYLADLDAISGQPPNLDLYRELVALGLALRVDAGLRNEGDVGPLLDAGISSIVLGLETAYGPSALESMLSRVGPQRLVFSLDLFEHRALMGSPEAWGTVDPLELGLSLLDLGVRRLLILDLSRVGKRRGTGTIKLLAELKAASPSTELSVGGGIASIEDVAQLRSAGASEVLIGSAIHDSTIGPRELASLR